MIQKKGRVVTEVLVRWKGEPIDNTTWELCRELHAKFSEFATRNYPWG